MSLRAAMVTAALLCPSVARADPPPKVCVAVVGDPDEAIRALADEVAQGVGASDDLRGVADADARAALRGEPAVTTNELTAARRTLRGQESDLATIRTLADPLGCGWFVEVATRPAGTFVRVIDVVRGTVSPPETRTAVDAPAVVALVRQMLTSAAAPAAPSPVDAGPAPSDAAVAGETLARAPTAALAPTRAAPSLLSRIWPWLLVGGVAFVGAAVAILVVPSPATQTRITVIHAGSR